MSFRNIFQTRHYFFFVHLILLLKLNKSQINKVKSELGKWNNNFDSDKWDKAIQNISELQD